MEENDTPSVIVSYSSFLVEWPLAQLVAFLGSLGVPHTSVLVEANQHVLYSLG